MSYAKGDSYEVSKTYTGYYTADEARNKKAIRSTGKVYKGRYYIYNTHEGMLNVTKVKNVPGSWINPEENYSSAKDKKTAKSLKYGIKDIKGSAEKSQENPARVNLHIGFYGSIKKEYQKLKLKSPEDFYPESFTYEDYASGSADVVTITYTNRKHYWERSLYPQEGDYIKATISVANWIKHSDNRKLKCGKFLLDDFYFNGPPETFTVSGISCPVSSDFASTKKSRSWKKITIKNVAATIAKKAGIALYFDAENYKIDELKQSNETDMNFLHSLCKDYNLAMKAYNDKLIIFDVVKHEKKKVKGTILKKDCESWSPHSKMTGIYHGVAISYKNSKKKGTLKYNYKLAKGKRILKVHEKADSYKDAEIKAKAKLMAENKEAFRMTLTLKGDVKYAAGTCYNVRGFGKLSGKYYIDSVRHSVGGGYSVELNMHKVLQTGSSKNNPSDKIKDLEKGAVYAVNNTLQGCSSISGLNDSVNVTQGVYKGKYYIYAKQDGMINITRVKDVPGIWVNPELNREE